MELSDFSLVLSETEGEYLVDVQNSKNLYIRDLEFKGLDQKLIRFKNSIIEEVSNVRVRDGVQVFDFAYSEVKRMEN